MVVFNMEISRGLDAAVRIFFTFAFSNCYENETALHFIACILHAPVTEVNRANPGQHHRHPQPQLRGVVHGQRLQR